MYAIIFVRSPELYAKRSQHTNHENAPSTKPSNSMFGMGAWIVLKLPNGDIRTPWIIEHDCHENCCKGGLKDFLRKLKWFAAVICGKMLIVFPRSRWTRLDEATDWVGVFCFSPLALSNHLWHMVREDHGKKAAQTPCQTNDRYRERFRLYS